MSGGIFLPGGGKSQPFNPFAKPQQQPQNTAGQVALEQWNNVCLTYLVPPREDRPFQSPRALIFSQRDPIRDDDTGLPGKIQPFEEVMQRELCDPDHLPGFVIQLNQKKQYVYCEGSIFEIIDCRISEVDDIDTGNSILKPGQSAVGYSGETIFRIEMDWLFKEETDPDLCDRIREIAWKSGIASK